ncbi:MAG TPA: glycosyl transferase family 2, partial [Candidatus Limnocylindria bacterium]|nr:glycosyl transferase family 2 [Candidatus Limnocylindria bacterium]
MSVASALDSRGRSAVRGVGQADLMVGIPSFGNADTIGHVVRAATAGMVQYFPDLKPVLVNADGGSADDTPRVAVSTESPEYLEKMILVRPRHRLRRVAVTYRGASGKGSAVRALLEVARELRVETLVLVDSDLRSIVPEWIELLAGPILKGGYDYVAPLYARHKFDGTITNHIAFPLTRTLYGRRIRQPIGGEFAISRDLVHALLEYPDWDEATARFGIDIWMTHHALAGGYAVCQTRLGAKIHDPKDPASDLGPMFRQVVGTLFRLAGDQAQSWLSVRGSQPVPEYGFERVVLPEPITVDQAALVVAFDTARLAQHQVWKRTLAGEQLERVIALPAESAEAFGFPSELWIRCLFDALLAYQRPGIDREALLAGLTGLYFGRVAGFINEARELTDDQAERLVEAQAREFEDLKPWLVRAWQSQTQTQT